MQQVASSYTELYPRRCRFITTDLRASNPTYVCPSYPTYVCPSYPTYVCPSYPTYVCPSYPTYVCPSYIPILLGFHFFSIVTTREITKQECVVRRSMVAMLVILISITLFHINMLHPTNCLFFDQFCVAYSSLNWAMNLHYPMYNAV
jgi:hypothetical protein